MAEQVMFYCLRCGHRFPVLHDSREVKERTCPKCLSNSVRKETPAAIEAREKRGRAG